MKIKNLAIIAVSIISSIIFLNCKTTSNQNTALKEQNWFKEMWLQDTCGQKGHRTVLSDFILYKQEKEKFFKNKKDVIQLLGEPYQVYSNDNSTSTIIYVVFSAIDCKTYSFGTITESIDFSFNKKEEIISVHKSIY